MANIDTGVFRVVGSTEIVLWHTIAAVDTFERAWGRHLLELLRRKYKSDEDWRQEISKVLGSRVRNHLPEASTFDLYQLCTLMLKLNHTLLQVGRANCSTPDHGLIASVATSSEEWHDTIRYLNNCILTFRNKLFHSCDCLSFDETLSALLAMKEMGHLFSQLADLDIKISCDEVQKINNAITAVQEQQKPLTSHESEESKGNVGSKETMTVRCQVAVRYLGLLLLQQLAAVLAEAVLQLQCDQIDAVRACDQVFSQERNTCVGKRKPDIQEVGSFFLDGVLKHHQSKTKLHSLQQAQLERLYSLLRRNPPGVHDQPAKSVDCQIQQLKSAFDKIVGKCGLRNHVCHSKTALGTKMLQDCLQKAKFLIQRLIGSHALVKLASVSEMIASLPNENDVCIPVQLSKGYPCDETAPISNHHYLLQPYEKDIVGRSSEISEICDALVGGANVAVIGQTGMGKTTVALHAAANLCEIFPRQYWLSGTSQSALRLSISRLGQQRLVPNDADDEYTASYQAGLCFLREAPRLLLVIDDVRSLASILSPNCLPLEFLYSHGVLFTSTAEDTLPWIEVPHMARYHLSPLSTTDCTKYLSLKCGAAVTGKLLSLQETWEYFAQQIQGCPLLLVLTARLLKKTGSIQEIKTMMCSYIQEKQSLKRLETGEGESRYSRCVSGTVSMLLETLPRQSVTLMEVFSLLARRGCTVPLWLFEENCFLECDDLDENWRFVFDTSPAAVQHRQHLLVGLVTAGLLQHNKCDNCVTIPLVIQKSILEKSLMSQGSADREQLNELHISLEKFLLHQFHMHVKQLSGSLSLQSPAAQHILTILPLAKSLLDNDVVRIERFKLLLWLSRCSYSLLGDLDESLIYLSSCVDMATMLPDSEVSPSSLHILNVEHGGLLWRDGLFSPAVYILKSANEVWSYETGVSVEDPLGICCYPIEFLRRASQKELNGALGQWVNQDVCCESLDPNTVTTPTPVLGFLAGHAEGVSVIDVLVEKFIHGLQVAFAGDELTGFDIMMVSIIEILNKEEQRWVLCPVVTLICLGVFDNVIPGCADDDMFAYFSELTSHLFVEIIMTSWDRRLRCSAPSKHKIWGNVPSVERVEKEFMETVYVRLCESSAMMRAFMLNLKPILEKRLLQKQVDVAFFCFIRSSVRGAKAYMPRVIRSFVDAFAWECDPGQRPVYAALLGESRRQETESQRKYCSSRISHVHVEAYVPGDILAGPSLHVSMASTLIPRAFGMNIHLNRWWASIRSLRSISCTTQNPLPTSGESVEELVAEVQLELGGMLIQVSRESLDLLAQSLKSPTNHSLLDAALNHVHALRSHPGDSQDNTHYHYDCAIGILTRDW